MNEFEDRALLIEAFFDHPEEMLREPIGIQTNSNP